jgi:TonB family protein
MARTMTLHAPPAEPEDRTSARATCPHQAAAGRPTARWRGAFVDALIGSFVLHAAAWAWIVFGTFHAPQPRLHARLLAAPAFVRIADPPTLPPSPVPNPPAPSTPDDAAASTEYETNHTNEVAAAAASNDATPPQDAPPTRHRRSRPRTRPDTPAPAPEKPAAVPPAIAATEHEPAQKDAVGTAHGTGDETAEGVADHEGWYRVGAAPAAHGHRSTTHPPQDRPSPPTDDRVYRDARLAWFEAIHPTLERAARTTPRMRREGWLGVVLVELLLAADGTLLSVELVASSGVPPLDEHAIAQLRTIERLPAPPEVLGERGRRVRFPVEFR